jgi:ketosteroid isomerase-like protein
MKRQIVSTFMTLVFLCTALIAQRGGGPPPVPPATGPMLDVANKIAEAINKQDAATLQKMLAPDAVYLDEDGHAPPPMAWINRLTMGNPAKNLTISNTHGQTWDNSGWVSFNYTLAETYQGQPKTLRGTASIVLKKAASGDWQITLVHGALEQKVPNLTN